MLHRRTLACREDGGGLENLAVAVRYAKSDNAVHNMLLTARRTCPDVVDVLSRLEMAVVQDSVSPSAIRKD